MFPATEELASDPHSVAAQELASDPHPGVAAEELAFDPHRVGFEELEFDQVTVGSHSGNSSSRRQPLRSSLKKSPSFRTSPAPLCPRVALVARQSIAILFYSPAALTICTGGRTSISSGFPSQHLRSSSTPRGQLAIGWNRLQYLPPTSRTEVHNMGDRKRRTTWS